MPVKRRRSGIRIIATLYRELRCHALALLRARPRGCLVIFAQGRTGTWLLRDLLNRHPSVTCDKEILSSRVLFPLAWVESHARLAPRPCFGFHVQVTQLLERQEMDPGRFLARLHDRGWKVLYLRRRNTLRQSISAMIADHRRRWFETRADALAGEQFTIDCRELQHWLDRRDANLQREAAALANVPHLALTYEDHLLCPDQHQSTMNRVFDYLELPRHEVQAGTHRIGRDDLSGYISNWAEITAMLKGTPRAGLLEE